MAENRFRFDELSTVLKAAGEETRLRLIANITELSSDQQELIFAHYFDGQSHAEVARRMGTTDKAIESKLYRARERLRELMHQSKEE